MKENFRIDDNTNEIELHSLGIPFYRELGMEPNEFVRESNRLLDRYNVKIPDNFSAEIEVNVTSLKDGVECPTSIKDFERRQGRENHALELPPFFINCIRLENDFGMNTQRFLTALVNYDRTEGLLHNGSLLFVALSYAKQGYEINFWPKEKKGYNPDMKIGKIVCDVKYVRQTDYLNKLIKGGKEISFTGSKMSAKSSEVVNEDACFNIGEFIKNSCSGICQADMLIVDLSSKGLRDLGNVKTSHNLPEPKAYRMVFFSRSVYTNRLELSYFLDFDPQLWESIRKSTKKYKSGAVFLSLPPRPFSFTLPNRENTTQSNS